MKRSWCIPFLHDWDVIQEMDGYATDVSWDTRGDCGTVSHGVFLERCRRCGKHRVTATGKYHRDHDGIKKLRKQWKSLEGKL